MDRIGTETQRPLFREHPFRVERSFPRLSHVSVLGILSDELGILKAPIQTRVTDWSLRCLYVSPYERFRENNTLRQ